MAAPLHPDIAQLAFLLGTWRGTGAGEYPTIDSFTYLEEVTFAHVGKPFLAYTQKTRHAVSEAPLHAEAGYLRPVGLDRVELVVAQPSGIVEVHNGTLTTDADGYHRIELDTQTVVTTDTAKDVTAVRRRLVVADDTLDYTLDMAAVGLPLQHHLRAQLNRIDDPDPGS